VAAFNTQRLRSLEMQADEDRQMKNAPSAISNASGDGAVKVINADVLVIGGGFAGAWAALRAKDFVDNVVLVDKAKVAKSGCSTFAAGVQFCPTEDDDFDVWKQEIVTSGDYFPDQEWVDIFLQNQTERVKDYEKWGAPIERDETGKIARIIGRGHFNTRIFQFHGPKLMALLREQMIKKGVRLIERIMTVDLLTSDGSHPTEGRVLGAIGFDTRSGEIHLFQAKATVMAAGPVATKRSYVWDNCTGDGVAAAFRAGAELTNMEFCTAGNITVWERMGSACGINMIQGYGAYFVNSRNERFMAKYDPALQERTLMHMYCMSFCKEALEGRGPIYVDMRHFPQETFQKFRRVLPRSMEFWDELGIDLSKQAIECTPHWAVGSATGQGGIKVNTGCKTNIDGLFAAGAVTRSPVQGIYSLGGIATASCNVMGYIAGENAAKTAANIKSVEINSDQVQQLKQSALSPGLVTDGIEPAVMFRRITEITIPAKYSMFKNERRIIRVLSELENIKEDLHKVVAADSHELVRANEVKNYLLCCELVFRAALERRESRQYHYREEFPYQDDLEWLKLIVFKKEGNRFTMRHEPIPLDKWPIKPAKFLKTSHPVQMFIRE
jgi:succinate dehydrogenase/fumarate reductase flavoprotein subunit